MSTALISEIIRADFSAMFEITFQHLHGPGKYQHNWHHDYLAGVLEQCLAAKHPRVIVALPPGHLKSTIMSVAFPAFVLGQRPEAKIIAASYSSELAENFSTQTRSVMEAPWYQEAFPKTKLVTSQATLLKTTKHGSRTATSVGGKITGFRADAIIVDDPMNYMDASSATKRAEVLKWFENLPTRLDDPEKGLLLLVMQRLHVDDLVANLLAKGGWHYVKIPLIATEAQTYDCGTHTHRRAQGDLLHPEYFSAAAVEKRRKEIGEHSFQAQYQQEPIAGSELMVPFDRFLPCDEIWPHVLVIQSWDVATTLNGGDFSVCTTWFCNGAKACLVAIHRAQVDFPTLKDRIRAMDKTLKPNLIIIEKDGIGNSLVQDLQRSGMKHVQAIKARLDKIARLQLASLRFGDGVVFIKPGIPGIDELRAEWNAFPEGKFDDQVDSITLFLANYDTCVNFARKRPNLRSQGSSGSSIKVINISVPTRMPDLW